jgi:hypothetical protein
LKILVTLRIQKKSALENLYKFSGMKNTLLVNKLSKKLKLAYAGVFFNLTIPQKTTDQLIALAQKEGHFESVGKLVHKEYFVKKSDPENLCRSNYRAKECIAIWKKGMTKQLKDATSCLKAMANKSLTRKEFVVLYSKFGKEILNNRFVLETMLRSVPGAFSMNFKVEGDKISKVNKKLSIKSTKDTHRFRVNGGVFYRPIFMMIP